MQRQPGSVGGSFYDPEASRGDFGIYDAKAERDVRHGFIRKVYGIVAIQLLATLLVTGFFISSSSITNIVQFAALPISLTCTVGALITLCYLACKEGASQTYPSNYILLGLFTAFESVTVGVLTTFYQTHIVLQAFFATTAIVLGLTLFAFQTKYDFTSWAGVMFYIFLGLMVFGITKALFWGSPIIEAVYAGAMAIFFSIYLLIDTQLLIGRGKIRIQEDNYIMAAIMIYVDVINLFIYMLRLIQALQREN